MNNKFAYNYKPLDKKITQEITYRAETGPVIKLSDNKIANCNFYNQIHRLPPDLYFIKMVIYPQNKLWAARMNCATLEISSLMKQNIEFDEILKTIETRINTINRKENILNNVYGIRRKECEHNHGIALFSGGKSRGTEYYTIYKEYITDKCINNIYTPKSNKKYKNAITCSIYSSQCFMDVLYGRNNQYNIKTNLDLVKSAYEELKATEHPTKKEIIETAATIQWLIAQECPYKKGSDSIANLLTRSLMHSYGIPIAPLKAKISCDFEAFYRNLDDYIKIYPTLFENNLGY